MDKVQGEIVEARTGEIIPRGSPNIVPGILAQIDISKVGTLELSQAEIDILSEPLNPEDVKIRPDELVYLPWTWYNDRLNKAFGFLKWGLIPQGGPMFSDSGKFQLCVWLHWLIVKGVPISMAGGETSYQPGNATMSKGDAIEGARLSSLSRNCKNIGMTLELWDPEWVANWKKKYAETYQDDRDRTLWRKKQAKAVKATAENNESAKEQQEQQEPHEPEVKYYHSREMRAVQIVDRIANLSGRKKSEVAVEVGGLDKNKMYYITNEGKIEEKK